MLGVRSGTGAVVVVVVGGGVVVVVVAGVRMAGGAVGGQESASARGASLKVSTVVPTAKAMTKAAPRPTPRRRTTNRDTAPVATRSNPSVTSTEMLAPVTGSGQFKKYDRTPG
jgi:hypothetical protein